MVEYLHDENLVLPVYTSRGFCRDKMEVEHLVKHEPTSLFY